MPVGLQVINDNNIVQIDQDYFNYSLASVGNIVLNTSFGGASALFFGSTPTYTGNAPIIAFKPTVNDTPVSLLRASVSGSSWSWFFLGNFGTSVNYWIFDRVSASSYSLENFGLEVRNSLNEIVYHSSIPILKVSGVQDSEAPPTIYPTGKSYATIQSALVWQEHVTFTGLGGNPWNYRSEITSPTWDNNELSSTTVIVETYDYPGPDIESSTLAPACQFVVVDVSNTPAGIVSSDRLTTLVQTLQPFTLSSNSTNVAPASRSASLTQTLQPFTLISDVVNSAPGSRIIDLNQTLQPFTLISSSTNVAPASRSASLTQTLQPFTLTSNSTNVAPAPRSVSLTQTLQPFTLTSNATNADLTPDAVNWNNISGIGTGFNASQTITGINQVITLQVTWTGTITGDFSVYKNGDFNGNLTNGGTFTVANNDTVFFSVSSVLETSSGTATVTNQSTNTVLDTFTFEVDASFGGGF